MLRNNPTGRFPAVVCRKTQRTRTRTHPHNAQNNSTKSSLMPARKFPGSISQRHRASLRRVLVKCGLNAGRCEAAPNAWNYCGNCSVMMRGLPRSCHISFFRRYQSCRGLWGRRVQHGQQRIDIPELARVRSGIDCRRPHFAGPFADLPDSYLDLPDRNRSAEPYPPRADILSPALCLALRPARDALPYHPYSLCSLTP